MPSAQTYASPVPVGFNNSGQIFGTALRKAKGDRFSYTSDPDCLIWTGTKFIDISPSLTIQNCNPYSINSENATGTYTLVGSYNDIYHLYGTAFLATITTAGALAFEPYDENVYSELIGVNSAGTATGETFATTAVRLVFTTVSRAMTVLQPACGKPAAGCIGGIPQGPLSVPIPRTCAFGGCTIDDSGRILGFDGLNSQFAIRTIGSSAATIDLPIYNTQYADGYVLGMNDAGQIPYIYTGTPNTTSVYDVTSATSTLIPPVNGTSCKHYDPLSINNLGVVLGFSSGCSEKNFYWIWDAANGTRDLSALVAPNAYTIEAQGINDNGQILVSLQTSTGAIHWGTLDPTASGTKPARRLPTARMAGMRAEPPLSVMPPAARPARTEAAAFPARNVPSIRVRPGPAPLAKPAYTIVNVGAPPGSVGPASFNNTGQIIGYTSDGSSCAVWTGQTFLDLTFPLPTVDDASCSPFSLNDANRATGAYEVVGELSEEYSNEPFAFAATLGPKGTARTAIYFANSPSSMIGVNTNGTAVAAAELSLDTLYNAQGLLYFTTTPASGSLTLLQPPGSPSTPPVHYLIPSYREFPCPFGGCVINARNKIIGQDNFTIPNGGGVLGVYSPGETPSVEDLPISAYTGATFNNADQVLYSDPQLGAAIYDIDTAVRTIVPAPPPGCTALPQPIGMNNYGEVLGFLPSCSPGGYFTWDPVHGTQFLDAEIPANTYTITPLAINDNGQILIVLESPSNVYDWGTLDPVTPSTSKRRGDGHSYHATSKARPFR